MARTGEAVSYAKLARRSRQAALLFASAETEHVARAAAERAAVRVQTGFNRSSQRVGLRSTYRPGGYLRGLAAIRFSRLMAIGSPQRAVVAEP
jgi:hypothetical protein